jgi:ABC-2 type transport system permease protein
MLTILAKTLKKNLITLIVYTAISASFVWMYVAMWPSFSKESEKFLELAEAYPEAIMKAMNVDVVGMFGSLEGFIAGEHFSIIWPIVLIILVLAYASSAIAGEVEKGTIELLLAQPISRLKIFFAKYFSGLAIITAFIILSNFSVVPFSILHNVDIQIQNYLAISIVGFFFAFAIFGICMMLSSVSSSRGQPMAITGGVLIIMYALNVFSTFKESLENLKYASFFHYYDFASAVVKNHIDALNIAVFLTVGIICTVIGAIAFVKRDITTT